MNGYAAMAVHNAVVTALIIAALYITSNPWMMLGVLLMQKYVEKDSTDSDCQCDCEACKHCTQSE